MAAGTCTLSSILAHDVYKRGIRKALLVRDQLRQYPADRATQQRCRVSLWQAQQPQDAPDSDAVQVTPAAACGDPPRQARHGHHAPRPRHTNTDAGALRRDWVSRGAGMSTYQRVALLYKLGRACSTPGGLQEAAPLVRQVLPTLEPAGFRPQDLALCLTAAARAHCTADDPAVAALLHHLAHAPPSFLEAAGPQALCSIAWALCKLGSSDPLAWNPLALAAEGQVHAFKPIDVANLAYSLAASGVLRHDPDWGIPLLGLLARRATQQAAFFNAQDLSNTAWAFAKARVPNIPLFQALGEAAVLLLPHLNNQALTNTVWALTTVAHTPASLMAQLAAEVASRLQPASATATTTGSSWGRSAVVRGPRTTPLSPTQLSVLAWSFQRAGHASPQLLRAVAAAAVVQLPRFQTFELGRLLWALADARAYDADLFAIATAELLARPDADLQELRTTVTLLRGLSLAGHYEPQLVARVLRLLQAAWLGEEGRLGAGKALEGGMQLAEEEAMALGLVATCLATLRHYDQRMLHLLASVVQAQARVAPGAVSPFLLTSVLAAHAFFRVRAPQLFAAASAVLATNPGAFQLPHLCHLLWAAGAGCHQHPRLLCTLFQLLTKWERASASLRAADAGRVVHGMAYLEAAMSPAAWQRLVEAQPPPWSLVLAATELFCSSQAVVTTDLQRSLASALRGLGLEVAQEARTHDEIFVCDLLVTWKGVKVAIEADGPHHTTANAPERMVGPWALKDLCLMHRGYAVARIPARRWSAARRAKQVNELLAACMDDAVARLHAHDQRRLGRLQAAAADPASPVSIGVEQQQQQGVDPGHGHNHTGRDHAAGMQVHVAHTAGSDLLEVLEEAAALDAMGLGFHLAPVAPSQQPRPAASPGGNGSGGHSTGDSSVPLNGLRTRYRGLVPVRAPKKRGAGS